MTDIQTYESEHGDWTISVDEMWIPGIYDSEATALAAVNIAFAKRKQFAEMQERVNHVTREHRSITQADLDALA